MQGTVTSFSLYTEALRFAQHGDKMIQASIRSLTLSIYNGMNFYVVLLSSRGMKCLLNGHFNVLQQSPFDYAVSDDMICQFLMTPPESEYFSDLILKLREECVHLDATVCSMRYIQFP